MAPLVWLPWSAAAFARARAERKPVLLSIVTSWSAPSRAMDVEAFDDPSISARVDADFVPVRVDADRRPDIADRYGLGGWPTTAFLNAEASLLGGGTVASAAELAAQLDRCRDAYAAAPDLATAPEAAPGAPAPSPPPDDLAARVMATFDAVHGGFGTAPKFPHCAALDLALDLAAESPGGRAEAIARASLDGIGWGGLADVVEGGFFRCAAGPGWDAPETAKLLDVNAGLLATCARALPVLGGEGYGTLIADTLRYTQTWLADHGAGGWYASQAADDEYYGPGRERTRRTAPAVDGTMLAGANAAMVSACLAIARLDDDGTLTRQAVEAFERVAVACHRPGSGLAHDDSPDAVRGLLADQVLVATAALDVFDATGNIVYAMLAEELMRFARRTMWSDEDGAFLDTMVPAPAEAIGRLRRRSVPFAANCRAATLLRRLAAAAGETEFVAWAETILTATARLAPFYGPEAAHHVLAVRAAQAG